MPRLISFLGLFVMLGLAWLLSTKKTRVSLRVLIGGVGLQFVLALLVLRTPFGRNFFDQLGQLVVRLLDFVDAGSSFVFGPNFNQFIFAFKVLPTIIFFSALMSVFYYLGLMQRIVAAFAWIMRWSLRTSGAETLSASANVFVGHTEAPLVIGPYVSTMTRSELMALMVGGFATVTGGLLAVYIDAGADASHLLTASVISAPAALVIAKIMEPETEQSVTADGATVNVDTDAVNVVDAAAAGASNGMRLALNVAAMLIAFLALLAMLDAVVAWVGATVFGNDGWSMTAGLGYAFSPLAFMMGIETADCRAAGELLGLRMVTNEVIAYQRFGEYLQPESAIQISERTRIIMTYALCGFANLGAIGIQIGGISTIAPNRRSDLAQLGLRAMLGGTLACTMTACIAGVLVA